MTHAPSLLSVTRDGAGLTMRLHVARFDLAVADDLKQALKSAAGAHRGAVTLDLAEVGFIDSSGLGALVALRKHLGEGRDLRLRNAGYFVQRVLELTRLTEIFR